ncbi:MAG: SLC13 family permease [Desulfobulbus sp.]|nr:MAG: SLC13 family permease [Desulfobulbus sp.]
MSFEIILVFIILTVAVILLATEWIPLEVTALLCLGTVAVTGLVTPVDALSGFSNPAVVTIWAVFILSGGLTKTGVAEVIGNLVLKMAGSGETSMIIVIMTTAGVLSAVMNNVAVAALMLPVVMDISRHTGLSPSRLLMPLAYGALLGGLTTQIGTPPNILVSDALRDAGLTPFTFFDFTPVGVIIMVTGILFMALIGRHLLPRREMLAAGSATGDWQGKYDLTDRLFCMRVPSKSRLTGKTLAEIRLGSILGWYVLAISRNGRIIHNPGPDEKLYGRDMLTIKGRVELLEQLQQWNGLTIDEDVHDLVLPFSSSLQAAAMELPESSPFVGSSLNELGFHDRFGVNVLAICRDETTWRVNLADKQLQAGDVLLVAGKDRHLRALAELSEFADFRSVSAKQLEEEYHVFDRLMVMTIPEDSPLVSQSLYESRLGEALGSRVLGILRGDQPIIMPLPGEILQGGDRLVVEGSRAHLDFLFALEGLEIVDNAKMNVDDLFSGNVGQVEAVLSPQTSLEGKTLRQVNFRDKFGLNVLALWRRGRAYRSNLRDMDLCFGDSLLLMGPRNKLRLLAREADFIVLSPTPGEPLRREKMKVSLAILAAVLLPVFLGWLPIYIAAVIGAAFMVLTGCLSMEEAYRQIEWKAVFLIAGMLPLGAALDSTGAAKMIAEKVVTLVGPYGSGGVMFGLVALTFLATCFVPTAALIVLMAPIVFNTAADMNLSPYGLVMAVAFAASASFMTPVSHPANILVMGPGGYRFKDYMLVGGLLTLVVMGVLMLVMPIFWPLNL